MRPKQKLSASNLTNLVLRDGQKDRRSTTRITTKEQKITRVSVGYCGAARIKQDLRGATRRLHTRGHLRVLHGRISVRPSLHEAAAPIGDAAFTDAFAEPIMAFEEGNGLVPSGLIHFWRRFRP